MLETGMKRRGKRVVGIVMKALVRPEAVADVVRREVREVRVALHRPSASVRPFGDADWHAAFAPDRVAILTSAGQVVQERRAPRSSFQGHDLLPKKTTGLSCMIITPTQRLI